MRNSKRLVGIPVLATAALAAPVSSAQAAPGLTITSYYGSDIVVDGSTGADRVSMEAAVANTVAVKTGVQPTVSSQSGCVYLGFDGHDHVTQCPVRPFVPGGEPLWVVTLRGGDDTFSATDVPGHLGVTGGDGADHIALARNRGSASGAAGADTITTWDGFGPNVVQDVQCGKGADTVLANWGDTVGAGCENVSRK